MYDVTQTKLVSWIFAPHGVEEMCHSQWAFLIIILIWLWGTSTPMCAIFRPVAELQDLCQIILQGHCQGTLRGH